MTDLAFRYNYRDIEFSPGYLDWLTIVLITPLKDVDGVREVTDDLTNVELRVTMNGMEVGAEEFIKRLFDSFDYAVTRKVEEIVSNIDLSGLHETITDAQIAAREVIRERLAAKGIKLPERDEY